MRQKFFFFFFYFHLFIYFCGKTTLLINVLYDILLWVKSRINSLSSFQLSSSNRWLFRSIVRILRGMLIKCWFFFSCCFLVGCLFRVLVFSIVCGVVWLIPCVFCYQEILIYQKEKNGGTVELFLWMSDWVRKLRVKLMGKWRWYFPKMQTFWVEYSDGDGYPF